MARNPNKLEKLQRESAFRPQQQYDEEMGHRDDWARGSRYEREFDPGRSGANFSNPSGWPDPDRGYGQDSRYSEWSRGPRQFDSSGYASQGRYSNHGYFGGSGGEYRGMRERDRSDDWRGYGNDYAYNAEGRDWSGPEGESPYVSRYRQGEATSREPMYGGFGHYGGERMYGGRAGISSAGAPYRGGLEGSSYGSSFGSYGEDEGYRGRPRSGAYGGRGEFGYEGGESRIGGAFGGGEGRTGTYGYESYGMASPGRWGHDGGVFERGEYSGRGPRGYQRSDSRIQEDVCDRLCQFGQVDASGIDVRVSGGEVTLDGTVPDRRQKRLAEDVIEDISGVKDVLNHIKVRGEGGAMPPTGENASPATNGAASKARTTARTRV
ncbi:MAG: BON domain-containing protein [Dehalococcoidia bacterium]